MKEKVIIDVYTTEDGYELIKVYKEDSKEQYPPSNCDNGYFFSGEIAEVFFKDWEVVRDYR